MFFFLLLHDCLKVSSSRIALQICCSNQGCRRSQGWISITNLTKRTQFLVICSIYEYYLEFCERYAVCFMEVPTWFGYRFDGMNLIYMTTGMYWLLERWLRDLLWASSNVPSKAVNMNTDLDYSLYSVLWKVPFFFNVLKNNN